METRHDISFILLFLSFGNRYSPQYSVPKYRQRIFFVSSGRANFTPTRNKKQT